MRLALGLGLFVFGLMALGSHYPIIAVPFLWGGWWVYERSGLGGDEGFIALFMILGAIGAGAIVVQFIWQAIGRLF